MKRLRIFCVAAALAVTGGCKNLDVPDFYAPSVESLEQGATRATIEVASVGLLAFSRQVNSVVSMGQQGREGISLDPSNPQSPPNNFAGPQGPSGPGWSENYRAIRQSNVILKSLDGATGLTPAEKEAVRGFVKTMKALAIHRLNNGWDEAGIPVDVDRPTTEIAPIAETATVKALVNTLLDEGRTHLQSASAAFPFQLGSGFTGLTTTADFLKFNRALRARAAAYVQDYPSALAALDESFLVLDPAQLTLGAYDIYSLASGDLLNTNFDPTCRQLFSIRQNASEAQLQADGITRDRRYVQKIQPIPGGSKTIHGIAVDDCFSMYTNASPIPIIRNEELILLRAEARWFSGDVTGALSDINFIRQNSGGLVALAGFADQTAFLDELLYNRRYSLIWEGGHRWVDMRRFGRLGQLPKLLPTHRVWVNFELPDTECVPRVPEPPGCDTPRYF